MVEKIRQLGSALVGKMLEAIRALPTTVTLFAGASLSLRQSATQRPTQINGMYDYDVVGPSCPCRR